MSVELILAPPAGGKTSECLRRVQMLRSRAPLAPVRVVVSNALQATDWRHRLALSGGAIGTEIGLFDDLYRQILQHSPTPTPQLHRVGAARMVRAAIRAQEEAGTLQHYGQIAQLPGFVQVLGNAFAELKRSMVDPQYMLEVTRSRSRAEYELALFYDAYQTRLQALGWADQEGLSWLAVEALERTGGSQLWRMLIIDGFDTFTGAQLAGMEALRNVEQVIITLPVSGDEPPREVEQRMHTSLAALREKLTPRETRLKPAPAQRTPLSALLERLYVSSAARLEALPAVELVEARSAAEEAREALRWIKARFVRDSIPLGSCAVFMPSPGYRPYLQAAAREFGIPLRFAQREPLSRSMALYALLGYLNLSIYNTPHSLLACLTSPYLQLGFTRNDADALARVAEHARITGGIEQWEAALHSLALRRPPERFEDEPNEGGAVAPLLRGEEAERLLENLRGLYAHLPAPTDVASTARWIQTTEALTDWCRFSTTLSSQEEVAAYHELVEIWRAMFSADQLAGERQLTWSEFCAELRVLVVTSPNVDDPSVGRDEAVVVSNVASARGVRFNAVVLLGLSEGSWPEVEHPDPFLGEALRLELGLDARLGRNQQSLFYQAVARADLKLLLTRPYLAEGGEDWEESPFWSELRRLLPEDYRPQRVRHDGAVALHDAASASELLFYAVRQGHLPLDDAILQERWQAIDHGGQVLASRRERRSRGVYEGDLSSVQRQLRARLEGASSWSTSHLETLSQCAMQYYFAYLLELTAPRPREPMLDVSIRGSLLHEILAELFKCFPDMADAERIRSALPDIARPILAAAPQRYQFRPGPLWESECTQMLDLLASNIPAITCMAKGFTAKAFETSFGRDGAQPLVLEFEDGTRLTLRGVIDRIDCNDACELRIIDYKSGSKGVTLEEMKLGKGLQLPIYALAAERALDRGTVVEGYYWQLGSQKPSPATLSGYQDDTKSGVEGAIANMLSQVNKLVDGYASGKLYPAPPAGGCPFYCAAAQFCWRYHAAGWR